MYTEQSDDVWVQQTEGRGQGVFAARDFVQGETVVVSHQEEVLPDRTIHSLQMDFDLHIQLDEPGRLINHCCNPNTGVRNNELGAYDFVALVDIPKGHEITFDYETTEYISIAIPLCQCGSPDCRGRTRGFKFLPSEIQERYGEFIADYLKPSLSANNLHRKNTHF